MLPASRSTELLSGRSSPPTIRQVSLRKPGNRRGAARHSPPREPSTPLRIALLSDLHAHDNDPAAPSDVSWLVVAASEEPTLHPFAALHNLIEREQLRADYVVCPGDIGDKANPK